MALFCIAIKIAGLPGHKFETQKLLPWQLPKVTEFSTLRSDLAPLLRQKMFRIDAKYSGDQELSVDVWIFV